jgi:three-Cys-motif partner protein
MHSYLQPQEDGLPTRPFGAWVAEKLDYLERYIYIFETSMRDRPWRKRHYIDLFAGAGKCLVREARTVCLGSPLLALTTPHPFTDYFFVDQNPDNIAILQQRCNVSPLCDHVQYFVGDSNLVVQEIVDHILAVDREHIPGKWSSLNLAFLDPDGLELHWDTVATLARPYTMDLIIHYPQGGLNRYMKQAFETNGQTRVDRFFGGGEWRDIYDKCQNRQTSVGIHRLLMDHYKEKLRGLGYKEALRDDEVGGEDEPLVRNAKRKTPLYRLLFASKHPLGHEFWQKVTRRDVHGQMHLL